MTSYFDDPLILNHVFRHLHGLFQEATYYKALLYILTQLRQAQLDDVSLQQQNPLTLPLYLGHSIRIGARKVSGNIRYHLACYVEGTMFSNDDTNSNPDPNLTLTDSHGT